MVTTVIQMSNGGKKTLEDTNGIILDLKEKIQKIKKVWLVLGTRTFTAHCATIVVYQM